jgi:uncharacterized protein YbjT (DUF2867 family)
MIKKVAFIGATGVLGNPVALELDRAGFEITALVRNVAKAQNILPNSIHLLEGNLEKNADLQKLLQGKDALYLNLNLNPKLSRNAFHPEREGLIQILPLAKKAGIKRIALISSLVMHYQGMNNFNWWIFDLKHHAVKMVRACGIPYTIFYPSTFFENFISQYRQGNKIMLIGKSQCKQWFIGAEDFGRQVARSFRTTDAECREYPIQGLDPYLTHEAAEIFIKNSTKKIKVTHLPMGILRVIAFFNNKASYGYHIINALNHYPETFQSQLTWDQLGQPLLTLKEFASRH